MWTIGIILGAGLALRWAAPPPEGTTAALDWYVIHVALPAVTVTTLPTIDFDASSAAPPLIAGTCLVATAAVVFGVGRWRRWDQRTTGTLFLVAGLGNTSFLGFPAVDALLGSDHLPYAVLYDVGSFLGLSVAASLVASWAGGSAAGQPGPLARLAQFPPFIAAAVSLPLRRWPLPEGMNEALSLLGASLVPVVMVSIALRLPRPHRSDFDERLAIGLGLKMVLAPALAAAITGLLGLGPLVSRTTVFEAAMPPMITAGVVAAALGLDDRLASSMVGIGLVGSFVTLPLLATVVG